MRALAALIELDEMEPPCRDEEESLPASVRDPTLRYDTKSRVDCLFFRRVVEFTKADCTVNDQQEDSGFP